MTIPPGADTEEGIITEVLDDGTAVIQVERSGSCAHCTSASFCRPADKVNVVTVLNPVGADVGQVVKIGLAPGRLVQATLLVYALPCAAFVLGIWAGYMLFSPNPHEDLLALATGFASMAGAFFIVRFKDKQAAVDRRFMPEIVRIVGRRPES